MLRPPPVIKIIIVHPSCFIRRLLSMMLSPLPLLAPLPQFDPPPHQILPSMEQLPASIGSRAVVIDEVRRRLVRSRERVVVVGSCCLQGRMASNVTGRHVIILLRLYGLGLFRMAHSQYIIRALTPAPFGSCGFISLAGRLRVGNVVCAILGAICRFERKSHTDVRAKLLSSLTLTSN